MTKPKNVVAVLLDEMELDAVPAYRAQASQLFAQRRQAQEADRKRADMEARAARLEQERTQVERERTRSEREQEANRRAEKEQAMVDLEAEKSRDWEFSGTDTKKAKEYFSHPDRRRWPKMREYQVQQVTPAQWPTKPTTPSEVIKGAENYRPPRKPPTKPLARQIPFRWPRTHS